MIELYVRPRIGGTELGKVDGSMPNAVYADLLVSGRTSDRLGEVGTGLSPETVRSLHGMLTKAFRDAIRWGRLSISQLGAPEYGPRGEQPLASPIDPFKQEGES